MTLIIEEYRKLFQQLDIQFLQNEMLIIKRKDEWYSEREVLSESMLLDNTIEWIREKCLHSNLTILGGIGFSGENGEFNVKNGIYRSTITTDEEEKKYTKEFYLVYSKVREAVSTSKMIILTHMPRQDWCKEEPVPKWIYVNGHTHINHFNIQGSVLGK